MWQEIYSSKLNDASGHSRGRFRQTPSRPLEPGAVATCETETVVAREGGFAAAPKTVPRA